MNVIVDRRMLKSPHVFDPELERYEPEACAECGKLPDDVSVELGDANDDDWDWYKVQFCLPCLKRAVAEAEAAVARDKGRPWDPIARVLTLAAELAESGDEWAITTAIERFGGSKGDICMLINDRFGAAYNRATPQEKAPMLRELAAAGPVATDKG